MKQQLPNVLTAINLLCGCAAILSASQGHLIYASLFVLFGAFFDLFDGMLARLLKVSHPLGAQLDSLADMVSFGVAPVFIVFYYLNEIEVMALNYSVFILAVFSALRLAKFNIDEEQKSSFKGLPTPANALFWVSIPLMNWQYNMDLGIIDISFVLSLFKQPILLILLSLLFSLLMISNVPMISLKFSSLQWRGNEPKIIFLLLSLGIIPVFLLASIPIILLLYLLVSIIYNRFKHP